MSIPKHHLNLNLLIAHCVYQILTALWPILHFSSFKTVSGAYDLSIICTVSLLQLAIFLPVLLALISKEIPNLSIIIAIAGTISLIVIDLVANISPFHIIDAILQSTAVVLWIRAYRNWAQTSLARSH